MAQNDKYIQSLIESIKKKEQGAIKPTYDPAKQADGLEKRLEGSGVTAEKRDSRNFIEKALNLTPKQNVLFDIFEIINRPQQMLFQGIKAGQEGEDVGKAIRKGFGGVGKDVQFKEILQNAGMEDSGKDIGADDIFGFVGDVLVDPIDLALVVATPFTGGASGAALAAKKGIQSADTAIDAYKAANTAFDLAKAAGKLDNAADLAKATKSLEKARVLANKANETKKLWQNLDVAAKNLNDIRATVKKGGSADGLADAFDAYKKALQPLKKRMTPLEYVFKQTKGGIKKSVNLIDNGVTGTLSKLDTIIHKSQVEKIQNAVTPEVAESLRKSFEAVRPWSTKYKDMKVAFNSIFDAAKALPDGLWNKTKEITGSRKQAMARMVKLNQLNVDEIQKVAKATGVDAKDIQTMLMRAYELERYNPTTKLADLFDLDYITNNPMTDGNFKAFKDYIYDALKNENGYSKYPYNQIDELFQKRTLENGVEAWFVRPDIKNQSYIKAMLKDMKKYMDDSVKGFEKADIRIDKLQKRIAEVENIRNAAADEILATAGRYVQDANGNVKVVLTTDEVADLKKLGINFKDGSVITHDQALKAVNGRIKKTTEKIKEISPKVNYTDLKDEAAKMVLPDGKPDLAAMGKKGRTFLPDDETQKAINKKVAAKWGTEDATAEVIKKRVDNGGITVINGKAIDADKGFQVAYDKTKEVPVDTIDDVLKYVKENDVQSYGVWYNDKTNKYVIDTTSTYTEDAYAAAAAGLFGKQDAVMSWKHLADKDYDTAFKSPDEFANTFVKKVDDIDELEKTINAKAKALEDATKPIREELESLYRKLHDEVGKDVSKVDIKSNPTKLKIDKLEKKLVKVEKSMGVDEIGEGYRKIMTARAADPTYYKEQMQYFDELEKMIDEADPNEILYFRGGDSPEGSWSTYLGIPLSYDKGGLYATTKKDFVQNIDEISKRTKLSKQPSIEIGWENVGTSKNVKQIKRSDKLTQIQAALEQDVKYGFNKMITPSEQRSILKKELNDLRDDLEKLHLKSKKELSKDAGKVKIGKKLYEPEDAKKYLNQINDKLNATKAKLEADKLKYGKVANNANLKTTKLQSKLDELRKTRPNTDFENEIKASRYYSDNDIREVTDFFDINKSPEMAELKKNFAKRYDAMYEDLNAVMGVALTDKFDAGYLRHVKTNDMRKFLDELDDTSKAYLKNTAIVGDTNKFRGRAFQMSAYEANMVGKEIQLNILENAKLSDEVKEIVTEASVIDMFEEDASKSIWDFISKGTDVIEKGQKIEAVMSTSLRGGTASLWDENLLKPFESLKDVDNATQQVINSREIIDKLQELSFTFKDEKLMTELAKELGKHEQLVIDKNLYNLISFNTSKDINTFADSMVKIIDSTNTMFKKYKLLSPGFQIRNLIGNMTNILLAGVNPLKILDNNVLAHRILSQGDELLMKRAKGIPLSAGETQMLDMFEEFTRKGFDQVFGAGNIENLASVYDIPDDIMKAMRGEAKTNNVLKRAMAFNGRMNEVVDRQFRMSAFIYAKQNPEILARVGVSTPEDFVRKVLFDPNDLSKVERQYLKRLIPFYTFTKKNLAYQMSNVWDNPNRYNKLMKSVDASWKMIGIDPKEEVEQYKRENMWIPVFVNKNGEYKALKANLPVGDFAEFISDPFKKVVSSTAPVIRSPFEMTMNTQAFTGMPIQEFKGQRGYQIPWLPRKAEYGLSQLGLDVPIAAGTDIIQGVGQVAGGNVGGGIEKAIGRSFLSSGSVEKARLSRDYDRLNELRNLMRYYKQEGVKILTLDEIESMQQQKSQTILQRIRALGRT